MDLLASLITAGVVGSILATMLALVRIALAAERRRADDWRTAAQTSSAANAVLSASIDKLSASMEQAVTSQREMLALLQSMGRRDAA